MAPESNALPIACVAVTSAVFGKTNENLCDVNHWQAKDMGELPCHIKVNMVL